MNVISAVSFTYIVYCNWFSWEFFHVVHNTW